jgi:hypothetical protein
VAITCVALLTTWLLVRISPEEVNTMPVPDLLMPPGSVVSISTRVGSTACAIALVSEGAPRATVLTCSADPSLGSIGVLVGVAGARMVETIGMVLGIDTWWGLLVVVVVGGTVDGDFAGNTIG